MTNRLHFGGNADKIRIQGPEFGLGFGSRFFLSSTATLSLFVEDFLVIIIIVVVVVVVVVIVVVVVSWYRSL